MSEQLSQARRDYLSAFLEGISHIPPPPPFLFFSHQGQPSLRPWPSTASHARQGAASDTGEGTAAHAGQRNDSSSENSSTLSLLNPLSSICTTLTFLPSQSAEFATCCSDGFGDDLLFVYFGNPPHQFLKQPSAIQIVFCSVCFSFV